MKYTREEYVAPKCFVVSFEPAENVNGSGPSNPTRPEYNIGDDVEQDDIE